MGAKADRVSAISFRRNVRLWSLLVSNLPDPAGVIAAIREQHRWRKQGAEANQAQPAVMRLAGAWSELDRQTIAVHDRVKRAGQFPRERPYPQTAVRDPGSVLQE